MKSIEGLSLCFTIGAWAGVTVSGSIPWEISPLVLTLAATPVLLKKRLPTLPGSISFPLILGSFLLLGFFAGTVNAFPSASVFSPAGWAETSCERLKTFIADIPFPSEDTASLLTALFTGDRSGLARETVSAFRESGASHILALSGLHLGIIYVLFDQLTRVAGQSPVARKLRFAAIVLGTGFFTLMTGASPSLVRAFLFILINEVLRLTGRPRKASRVLCLALLIQLVLDPSAIRSLGFQLSYLAMAGIFFLYPVLETWYPSSPGWDPFRRIWKAAALSISCQIFTGPLVWLRFHTFPRYFLLTNLLALPLTTLLMTCAVATVTLSAAGICPALLIKTTDTLCQTLQRVLEIIASM
jgi:competence protein ComEC